MAAANDPDMVARLVKIFELAPTSDLVSNLTATVRLHKSGDQMWPMSISDGPTCYICSPTVAYIDYGLEETRHFVAHPRKQRLLKSLIRACRPIMRATQLDRQVQINNWMFSTNPAPVLTEETAMQLRNDLSTAYPDRAIVMRSLNDMCDASSMAALRTAGFLLLPARQIYILDTQQAASPSVDVKRDAKLLADSSYEIVPAHHFSAADFSRAAELYSMLYLDKYTPLNPQYTPRFLAQAHQIDLLRLYGLRGTDDTIDGVAGVFRNGDTITVPIIGYDTTKPQDLGLYRMLNAVVREAEMPNCRYYNMSAGAATFKRHRGAQPAIEYTAVYVRHLNLGPRLATRFVQTVLRAVAVPILRRTAL